MCCQKSNEVAIFAVRWCKKIGEAGRFTYYIAGETLPIL